MLDKNDTFNIKLGKEYYEQALSKYSNVVPWEKLSNDLKEVYILIGLRRHKQTTVEYFHANRVRHGNNDKEQG